MPELSIAVFNLHWGVDMRGHSFDAMSACLALDADVLVLPEAWRPHGRTALIDELADRTGATLHDVVAMTDTNHARPRHLRPPSGPPGTCGLAMLSRVPVRSFTTIPLPQSARDVIHRRHAIVAEIPFGDTVIAIAGIHASHRLRGSLPQLRAVDRELRTRDMPSIIAGDCNMWGPPLALAMPERRRAVRGRTWPAWRPHSQIDHIWIDDAFDVVDARIGPAVGSDHRAVRATVRLR